VRLTYCGKAQDSTFLLNNGKKKSRITSYNIIVKHIVVIEVKYKKYPCSFLEILLSALFLESFSHVSKSTKERFSFSFSL